MTSYGGPPAVLALLGSSAAASLARTAEAAGLRAVVVSTLSSLLGRLQERPWAVTLISLSAGEIGEEIARRIADDRRCGALIVTASSLSLDLALFAERVGAAALLKEPLRDEELRERMRSVLEEGGEIPFSDAPTEPENGRGAAPILIGHSAPMGSVFETLARVAPSSATVLLTGESGTGKEVVARALHAASGRGDRPFVAVNCAAIPEHLLESELFGHERGAFTGAVARRVGRFERADGGTLFLDEVGDMSLVLQAKLLRTLEERVVERVGGDEEIPIDVRVVAATNRNLATSMSEGGFREDLYYRLAVVEIDLPPLRERGSDLRTLALHFGAAFAARHRREVGAITESALARLESYAWPGNVRELRNVLDRAVLLAKGFTVRSSDLRLGLAAPTSSAAGLEQDPGGYGPTLTLETVEADHIRRVLAAQGGHVGRAADVLGIHRNTLARKLKAHGLRA